MAAAARGWSDKKGVRERLADLRRAFREFLTVPTLIIVGFLVLAAISYWMDLNEIGLLAPLRAFMRRHVFADAAATSELLGTIAGGLITLTSITFSLLLLAVQQSGSSLTAEVFDQFLRRRFNQVYFGFSVGLTLYSLLVLATVAEPFNPVIGASLALLLTAVGLFLLIVLLYATINQIRPVEIIETIHDHTLVARDRQLSLIRRSRRRPQFEGVVCVPVRATEHGYVTVVDLEVIAGAARSAERETEVSLLASVGSFVGFQDAIAEVRAQTHADAERLAATTATAVRVERTRDLDGDPAYGIEQLTTIAWTTVSTSKQNPSPGLLVTRALRDLAARWAVAEAATDEEREVAPLVYRDTVPEALMEAFASLAVVASESLQHQVLAEVYRAFAALYGRLPPDQQARLEDLILRSLSALGEHVPTRQLDDAVMALIETLTAWGRRDTAATVQRARAALNESIGRLNSRATRVPGG